ncbi:MAG: helix-turn-helix transcriptional regulator, partial [Christensenellaceae bacterium]|nr:helix-turn-helix transcriptional regulator [Christensenellaceae bacterium]
SEEEIRDIRVSYRKAVGILGNSDRFCGMVEYSRKYEQKDLGEMYLRVAQSDFGTLHFALEDLFSCIEESDIFSENVNNLVVALLAVVQVCLNGELVNEQLSEVVAAGFGNVLNARSRQELIEASVDFLTSIRQNAFNQNENRYIQAALEYIEQNYAEDISLESTARHIAISSSTLSRLFRTELEKSFTEVLIDKRISKACMMIKEGRLSIKEICFEVGYNDPNYFSRVFKKTTGLSPSDYREYGI